MKLSKIIEGLQDAEISGSVDRDVESLAYDSRAVKPGSLFVALRGQKMDGHHYIEQAIDSGAVAILCEEHFNSTRATMIRVPGSRPAMALLAANFYRNPSCRMKTIAVTGTNGKTTTTFLIKHILQAAMQQSALIGTVRYEIGERILPADRTTPESVDLQRMLDEASSSGCKSAVMEASSHALVQDRLAHTEFDVGVFTNLSQDHLDYHRTMDEYFSAKQRLFIDMLEQKRKKGKAVVNIDDKYGQRLTKSLEGKLEVLTYGLGANSTFRAEGIRNELAHTSYELNVAGGRKFLVRVPLIGRFNVYNSLATLAAVHSLGVDLREAVKALAEAPQVPGRLEAVPAKRNFSIYVDYAHTPDALENVLKTLQDLHPSKLIVVFGCGGDRDKAKRPLMARAVEKYADLAIVTSDNPRGEPPMAIIGEILKGFRSQKHTVVEDRKEAVFKAVEMAGEKNIVLIAGKGHENYQEVEGRKYPFSDVETAGWALMEKPADYMQN